MGEWNTRGREINSEAAVVPLKVSVKMVGGGWTGEIFRVRPAGSAEGLVAGSEEGRGIRTIMHLGEWWWYY